MAAAGSTALPQERSVCDAVPGASGRPISTSGNPTLYGIRASRLVKSDQQFGLGANATWQRAQSVRSLNPRPLKIIGTHFSARAARVFACFAPET